MYLFSVPCNGSMIVSCFVMDSSVQTGTINPVTFSKSFEEWRYCQYEIKKMKGDPLFECLCCVPQQHSVHVDGNRKLYRYSKVPR